MADIVERLCSAQNDKPLEVATFAALMCEAADEIERLRRHVSLLQGHDTLAQYEAHIDEQAAEIEHLRRDRDDYKQLYADALRYYVDKRDEAARLRAALTLIRDGYYNEMSAAIARRALEGKDG